MEPALASSDFPVVSRSEVSQEQSAVSQFNNLAAIRAAQQEDIKAFQQLLERRVANMEAMKEMQQADVEALGSLESLLRQARGALTSTPNSTPAAPAAVAPIPHNLRTQLDSLSQNIQELNRTVQDLTERESARDRRAAK